MVVIELSLAIESLDSPAESMIDEMVNPDLRDSMILLRGKPSQH